METSIRDRVKEFKRVKASELVPNEQNWRRHTQLQKDAMQGVLTEIGFAGALLVRELPDGRYGICDGHLRAETIPDMDVPVLILDVDEREAKYLLATHDPLGAMAEKDDAALAELLKGVSSASNAVQEMLAGLYKMPADYNTQVGEVWEGMPEFEQEDKKSFAHVTVHFNSAEDRNDHEGRQH